MAKLKKRWRFEIQNGPNCETNYAWVFNPEGEMVCTARLHHAAHIVEAANAYTVIAARIALQDAQGRTR